MKKFTLLIAIATMAIMFSCAPSKTMVDTSCPGYRSLDFNRADLATEGIGIMPVLGGSEKEQFRRPMGESLFYHFSQEFGQSNVRSTQQVIQMLNEQDLAEEYSMALANYQHAGIIPASLIRNIGQALDVEYLLYTRLLARREIGTVYSGYFYERVDVDELLIQTQVWSISKGDVVWEGKGGIARLPRSDANMVDLTAKGLVDVIGNDPNLGPCEKPGALIDAVQRAATNTYLTASLVSLAVSLIIVSIY